MRALAAFAMRSRWHAIALTAILGTISWLLIPVTYPAWLLSGGLLALCALRKGGAEALRVLSGTVLVSAGLSFALVGDMRFTLALLAGLWLPVLLAAIVLRRTESQGLMVASLLVLGIAVLLLWHAATGDPVQFWNARWAELERSLPEHVELRVTPEQRDALSRILTGVVVALITLMLIGAALLARWWQAELYNPSGFGTEFRRLRLPRVLWFATVISGVLALTGAWTGALVPATELFMLLTVAYLFQGLAVVHHHARARAVPRGWLALMYAGTFLLPQLFATMISMIGVADAVMNFRRLDGGPRPA
ncbi:MAG: DUF2232 domain-containing protein [Gammaproteobacteria bacterium]